MKPKLLLNALLVVLSGALGSPAAQIEVGKQKEADWVDARWNSTDLGSFHASLVDLPGGTVAKGLSIKLGNAAVAYDTGTATWRAGWTGGFLKFDGMRYGLIRNPQPDGVVRLMSGNTRAWGEAPVRWRGLHVNGSRVVLDYTVGGTRIQEMPGFENKDGVAAFTRTIELEAGPELALELRAGKNEKFEVKSQNGVKVGALAGKTETFAVAVSGPADLHAHEGSLRLHFPGRKARVRVKVVMTAGTPGASALSEIASVEAEDPAAIARPGPSRWKPITVRGQRGFGSDSFVIDTLTVPYSNPWNALFFTSGVDFLPNGDAAVCTIHGDVWLVSGIDEGLQRLTWRRFATGLFQPLGLRVRDGKIFVLGRDQITIPHDLNGDGEADFYENFFNGIHTSTGGHDYATSLEKDTNGNFFYVDPRGAHKVAADGSKQETIATGWRNPNGMGVSPDGKIVTVAPQEGEWTPSSAISEAKPAGWYGYGGPKITPDRVLGYDTQLCWIPHSVDNSGGSQLWVTSDRWQPLQGRLLHFSYGRCSQMLVLREVVDGVAQAAVTPLPGRFLSGVMRGAFNPKDGQLYVVGSTGWQTSAARDGCLQRVRFTGTDPHLPIACHVHKNGFRLTFTSPLDRSAAEDTGSYAISQWNYRYAAQYGSKDWSVADAKKEGHDTIEIQSARLLPDGRSVFIVVAQLAPVMQYEIKYSLNSAKGKAMKSSLWGTINRVGARFEAAAAPAQ